MIGLKFRVSVANQSETMETDTTSKNRCDSKSQMSKKNFLRKACVALLVANIVFLSGCNYFSNTERIKRGIYGIDYSISIGDALDNYKYFTKTEWKEFTTSQGREVVEFKGYYFKNDVVVKIQFRLNKDLKEDKDGSNFDVGYQSYSYLSKSGEKREIEDKKLIDKIYKNKEISALSNVIAMKKTKVPITGVEESFLGFFEEFIKNKNSQIASINKPLIYKFTYYDDLDEEGEIVEETKHWNEADLKENWDFCSEEIFFDGTKIMDEQQYYGKWDSNTNSIVYELGIPESGFFVKFIFKKRNDKWYLFEYECNNI